VAIEWLAAAQGCDFHQPLKSSDVLERVRARLRREAPTLKADRYIQPEMRAAVALVEAGAAVAAAAPLHLPSALEPAS
jgi:histidine ammonia-lyase